MSERLVEIVLTKMKVIIVRICPIARALMKKEKFLRRKVTVR